MPPADNERRVLCGICPAGCPVIATYDDRGKLSDLRADETSPMGIICELGRHAPEILYSEHRPKTPLKRVGPKGTFEFEPISWDQAFDEIVTRLEAVKAESGSEATSIYTGRGSFDLAMCDVFQPDHVAVSSASSLLFPFGSPNTMGVGALCYVAYAMIAPHVTMGGMLINMFSDVEQADLIVVWGANPATDCPPLDLKRIIQAKERGARVVVIDPRRTMTAKLTGATWMPIRPGTDGALALGLLRVVIEEELYDHSFAQNWTHGFDDLARYAGHFHPEAVESITGVPADDVRRLARDIASAHGASPVMYTGLEYSDSGVQAIRATMVLWALAGQMDVPGGRCFAMPQNFFPINRRGHVANPDVSKALGRDTFPVYSLYRGESHANCLPDAVLKGKPYPIRSLIILGGSIITSWPQPQVWRDTLAALDHLVCIDVNLTADCAYADIVLPAAYSMEAVSYMTYGPLFRVREKVIDPPGEAKNPFFILSELARRLGYGHLYPQSEDELLRHALEGSPFSLEDVRAAGGEVGVEPVMMQYKKWEKGLLRADGNPGFETPTGKFEIQSTILEEQGYDPLPVYTEPQEGPMARPDLAKDYPLVFNSGARVTTDFRSQFHHVPGLNKKRPEPTVTINAQDAKARGIQDGHAVWVISPRGRVRMRALVTDDIVPGAIEANMGGGGPLGPEAWREANINDLTDHRFDPISGFPIYKALLCDVVKADGRRPAVKIDSGEISVAPSATSPLKIAQRDRIYLDHNATTPVAPRVKEAMREYLADMHGNAGSIYHDGRRAKRAMDDARRRVAGLVGCTARRIVFTGGGSEANNLAIKGVAGNHLVSGKHVITSTIEHPSVLRTCGWLERIGFKVTYLPVDRHGLVIIGDLEAAMDDNTDLVTIMMANNETGSIQPIADLARVAHDHGALFHTDAVQAVGKMPVDVARLGVDLLTMSGHKLYGPKGVGALFVGRDVDLEPLVHGGGQEWGLRAGTENAPGIAAFGLAASLAAEGLGDMGTRVLELRDRLWHGIAALVPEARLNGHPFQRLPNTLNVTLPGFRGESMVLALDQRGVALSSGSACRAGSPEPSHALLAMGLSEEEAHCALRFSLGIDTTAQQIDRTVELMGQVIHDAAQTVRFVPCR